MKGSDDSLTLPLLANFKLEYLQKEKKKSCVVSRFQKRRMKHE